jgi:hypothetical protein
MVGTHWMICSRDLRGVSIRQVQEALNDRANAYPALAIDPLPDRG